MSGKELIDWGQFGESLTSRYHANGYMKWEGLFVASPPEAQHKG